MGTRDIRYAEGAEEDGSVGGDDAWRATQYHNLSVMMRRELAQQLQVPLHPLLIVCAKASRHGGLTPLLIDLPRGSRPMHFVMVRIYTRGEAAAESISSGRLILEWFHRTKVSCIV